MPLDPSLVGRAFPPVGPYEVGREKIREFADAIGDANPAYRDPRAAAAHGHADVVAPPTFAVIAAFRGQDAIVEHPDVDIDYSRVVHGEQRFRHVRPLRPGDRVLAVATIETARTMGGNDILGIRTDLVLDAEGQPGELVCQSWSTLVARGEG
jgi:acyl dehydratase